MAGCGSIGSRYVAWLRELGAEVAAFDPDPGRGAAFRALDDLLRWKPERVLVATPPNAHADAACERPDQNTFATSISDPPS